jgi:GR25 family glycosyltransferase involved in LPS biosynthesis
MISLALKVTWNLSKYVESLTWIKLVHDISSCQFVRAVLLYVNCFQICKVEPLIVSFLIDCYFISVSAFADASSQPVS